MILLKIFIDLAELNKKAFNKGILSQSELAKKSGLTDQTITRVMSGESVAPLTLRKLCKVLDCDPIEIVKK